MREFLNSVSIEDACSKIEGLDIFNNSAAREIFFRVAIDYSRHELRKNGIDLRTLAMSDDLHGFCRLWMKSHSNIANDMALIALTVAIQSNAHEIVAMKNKG